MKNPTPIKIGKKFVGKGHKCYIIAEIGSNFDGDLSQAKELIRLAKKCGADAAKFQSFLTEKILSKRGFEKKSTFQARWKKSVWDVYKEAELPREWHEELNAHAKKCGIHFFSTPYDLEAVDLLDSLDVPAIKIGSGDITHFELLRYVGKKQRPIILGTGSSTIKEVADAIRVIKNTGNNKIILLHATVQYPSPIQYSNLKALATLEQKFGLNVGYSDHTKGSLIALASVALGASIIEKHFTINPKLPGPDHPHSMDPHSFGEMIQNIRLLEVAMGDGVKKVQPVEKKTVVVQRRGIWTMTKINKGEKFTVDNIRTLRPELGIPASRYESIIGRRAQRNFKPYEPLRGTDF